MSFLRTDIPLVVLEQQIHTHFTVEMELRMPEFTLVEFILTLWLLTLALCLMVCMATFLPSSQLLTS